MRHMTVILLNTKKVFTFEAKVATLSSADDDISIGAVSISLGLNRSTAGNNI
jgi:hypothetical protein